MKTTVTTPVTTVDNKTLTVYTNSEQKKHRSSSGAVFSCVALQRHGRCKSFSNKALSALFPAFLQSTNGYMSGVSAIAHCDEIVF